MYSSILILPLYINIPQKGGESKVYFIIKIIKTKKYRYKKGGEKIFYIAYFNMAKFGV